jgi:hypothetical protein
VSGTWPVAADNLPPVSEYERPDRAVREPTVEDVRQLMGASTPHFALQIRNRIQNLVAGLPPDHPARVKAEREIVRLEQLARGSERRGAIQAHERGLPSFPGE